VIIGDILHEFSRLIKLDSWLDVVLGFNSGGLWVLSFKIPLVYKPFKYASSLFIAVGITLGVDDVGADLIFLFRDTLLKAFSGSFKGSLVGKSIMFSLLLSI
jgi:hypothetical protein